MPELIGMACMTDNVIVKTYKIDAFKIDTCMSLFLSFHVSAYHIIFAFIVKNRHLCLLYQDYTAKEKSFNVTVDITDDPPRDALLLCRCY